MWSCLEIQRRRSKGPPHMPGEDDERDEAEGPQAQKIQQKLVRGSTHGIFAWTRRSYWHRRGPAGVAHASACRSVPRRPLCRRLESLGKLATPCAETSLGAAR